MNLTNARSFSGSIIRTMEQQQRKPSRHGAAAIVAAAVGLALGAVLVASENGRLRRPHALQLIDNRLGATLEPLDEATARSLGGGKGTGALVVTSIATGGAADGAGIEVGDIVERINAVPAAALHQASAALTDTPATLAINRHGKHAIVQVQPPANEARTRRDGDAR